VDQCFQQRLTVCFECLQMIHITSWSCYSFRTQTKNKESRSAVEIQQLKNNITEPAAVAEEGTEFLGVMRLQA